MSVPTSAATTGRSEARPEDATALVVSGGVSLGAYQAGFLYFYGEARRSDEAQLHLPLVTGASAGSANGFLAALAACLDPVPDPLESLGWKVWGPVGFDELLDEDHVRAEGVFSRTALVRATTPVWAVIERGLPERCDFVVGVSTTRVRPLEVELEGGLRIPRQEEKFAVRIRGRGVGQPVQFTNYVDPYDGVPQPLLPFEDGHDFETTRRNFERFRTLLFASMAFPIAFPPQLVAHCLTEPPDQTRYLPELPYACPQPQRTEPFVDGGVLDNAPLRLAHDIARGGLRTDATGRARWRDLTVSGWTDRRPEHSALRFVYVDPFLTVFPSGEAPTEGPRTRDAVDLARELFGNFVYVARSKELYTFIEGGSTLARRVDLSHRYHPSAGDPLYAFMGFFERDFRWFDFYLGMYDAHRLLRQRGEGSFELPFSILANGPEGVPAPWRPFTCLLGWLEPGRETLRSTCEGDALRNFRILLQVSIDRLWDQCGRFPAEQLPLLDAHPQCRAAANDDPRPIVFEGPETADPGHRARGEWHARYALDRMGAYGLDFHDLELSPDEAGRARAAVRGRMTRAFSLLAHHQRSGLARLTLGNGGRVLANQLAYEVPVFQLGALVGTSIEAVALVSPFPAWRSWFRFQVALQARNWISAFTPDPASLGVGVVAGPEVLLPFLTGSIAQTSLGVRGGYQLSTRDDFGSATCRPSDTREDPRHCSQALVEPFVAIALFDRLRFQLGFDFFPEGRDAPGEAGERFEAADWGLAFTSGITFF